MGSPIIVALDMDHKSALELAKKIDPEECKVKVGSQLFTTSGPEVIRELKNLGFEIFCYILLLYHTLLFVIEDHH